MQGGTSAVDGTVKALPARHSDLEGGIERPPPADFRVDIESFVSGQQDLDFTLVRLEAAPAGQIRKLGSSLSLVGIQDQGTIQARNSYRSLVGVDVQIRVEPGHLGLRFVVLDPHHGVPGHFYLVVDQRKRSIVPVEEVPEVERTPLDLSVIGLNANGIRGGIDPNLGV